MTVPRIRRSWRLLVDAAESCAGRDGAWNMAADEALAESVAAGAPPVLRLYTWSPACVSLGRNQPARGRFDTRLAQRRGIDIVRRPTGGLAVHHDRELTYAVAMPVALLGGPRRGYREINRAIVNGLRRLGVAASIAGIADAGVVRTAARPWHEPCFREAARGEVVAGGRKLVGSAQRCERGVLLQHGSILMAGDQSPVIELQHFPDSHAVNADIRAESPAGETPARSTTLHELLGRCPAVPDLAAAVAAGFEDHGGIRFAADSLTREERRRASRLSKRYRSDAWTWRR